MHRTCGSVYGGFVLSYLWGHPLEHAHAGRTARARVLAHPRSLKTKFEKKNYNPAHPASGLCCMRASPALRKEALSPRKGDGIGDGLVLLLRAPRGGTVPREGGRARRAEGV